MKRFAAALLLLCACGDDDGTVDERIEASVDAGAEPGTISGAVASSLAAWNALVAANPGAYWYEEENCLVNGKMGRTNFVQVEQGPGRVVGSTFFPRDECRARVNRYGTLIGDATMPALHAACEALLKRRTDTRFRVDAQGVISECWVGDAPNCRDNCGEGFFLVRRGFGQAPTSDAGL